MDEQKIDKRTIIDKIIFLLIGAGLFFLLFDVSEALDYTNPIIIVKLLGIAVYLLVGEKIVSLLLDKIRK